VRDSAERHPETKRKNKADWREEHRDKRLASKRDYYARVRPRILEVNARARAELAGVEVEELDYLAIWVQQGRMCAYCGTKLDLAVAEWSVPGSNR
jgi:hypothetical protein